MERINKNFTSIGDICKDICSGGTPNTSHNEYYENGNIPWVNTNEVNFCNIYDTNKYITEIGLKESSAKFVPINTIIVAMYGVTAGKSAIAKVKLTTNQACCNLIIDENKAYYKFVYYWLKLNAKNLNLLANGSAQQNLNSLIIRKYKIPSNWSVIKQKKIADILSCYDELIEKNNRKIVILEEQIQELYKEWFVRFRFPGYENVEFVNGIPKGWSINRIGECCENVVIGGDAPNDFLEERTKDYKYPIYSNGIVNDGLYGYSKTYKVSKASVTVSARGTVGFVCMRNTEYTPIVRLISLIPKDFIKLVYFYQNLKYVDLGGNGTSQQQLTAPMIMKRKMLLADQKVICMYDNIAHKIFEEIDKLKKSNNNMSVTRDLLLPRLMSGKLKV